MSRIYKLINGFDAFGGTAFGGGGGGGGGGGRSSGGRGRGNGAAQLAAKRKQAAAQQAAAKREQQRQAQAAAEAAQRAEDRRQEREAAAARLAAQERARKQREAQAAIAAAEKAERDRQAREAAIAEKAAVEEKARKQREMQAAIAAAEKTERENQVKEASVAVSAEVNQGVPIRYASGGGLHDSGVHPYSATAAHAALLTPAAKEAIAQARRDTNIGRAHEEGGWIYEDGTIQRWAADPSTPNSITPAAPIDGKKIVASFHSHPESSNDDEGGVTRYYQDPSYYQRTNEDGTTLMVGDRANQMNQNSSLFDIPSVILGADGINRYY